MQVVADLQIHSRFARAVSKEMTLPNISQWAKRKGIGLVATGDWTHPMWFREIERDLEEMGNGLLRLKSDPSGPSFMLATEVSSIFSQGGRGRRVHTLIWVPTLESARKINQEFTKRGCNLMSDGRPIIGLSCIQVAELVLSIESKALIIPAHAWTPWFGVLGGMSGFDSLEEAFGPYAKNIYALETGLSSNPSMNWQIKELDNRAIVSFSDAHSGPKLGREATVFDLPEVSYHAIYAAIQQDTMAYTVEFYPEEGKYHYSGHRLCNIRWGPEQTKKNGTTCPVCGKPLTQGVVQRVAELSGRNEEDLQLFTEGVGLKFTKSALFPKRPGFVMVVPLQEIIAECIGSPVASNKTQIMYQKLTDHFGGEFPVLLHASKEKIKEVVGEKIAEGIEKVRTGDIAIDPGYDGVFGVVKIWKEGEESLVDKSKEQLGLF